MVSCRFFLYRKLLASVKNLYAIPLLLRDNKMRLIEMHTETDFLKNNKKLLTNDNYLL